MNELNKIFGIPCVITSHKKQKKTSKYKPINRIYKTIYGYKEEVVFPENTTVILSDGVLYFRDEKTFNQMAKMYKDTLTYNLSKVRNI